MKVTFTKEAINLLTDMHIFNSAALEALSLKVSEFPRGEHEPELFDITISGECLSFQRNLEDNTAVVMTVEEADRLEAGFD